MFIFWSAGCVAHLWRRCGGEKTCRQRLRWQCVLPPSAGLHERKPAASVHPSSRCPPVINGCGEVLPVPCSLPPATIQKAVQSPQTITGKEPSKRSPAVYPKTASDRRQQALLLCPSGDNPSPLIVVLFLSARTWLPQYSTARGPGGAVQKVRKRPEAGAVHMLPSPPLCPASWVRRPAQL